MIAKIIQMWALEVENKKDNWYNEHFDALYDLGDMQLMELCIMYFGYA